MRGPAALAAVLLVAALLVAHTSAASADDLPWLATDDSICAAAPLRAKVAALVDDSHRDDATHGDDATRGDDATHGDDGVAVTFRIERAGDALRGTVIARDRSGERGRRSIDAADCAALVETAALVIAMVRSQPAPDPADVPAVATPAPTQANDATGRLAVLGGLAGGVAGDGVAAGAFVGVAWTRPRWSLGLEVHQAAPQTVDVAPGHAVVWAGTIEAAGCARRGPFAACATAAAGWVRGYTEALAETGTETTPSAALGARVTWERRIARTLALHVRAAARAPLTRNRFLVDDQAVWSSRRVEGWLGIGLTTTIP